MHFKNTAVVAVALVGSGLLAACEGTDLNPGAPIIINTGGTTGGGTTGGGTTGGGTTGGGTGGTTAPTGALTGSLGTGSGTTRNGGNLLDPFSITTYFRLPGFGNTTSVVGQIDNTGFPLSTATALNATFTAPTVWPPVTATEAVSMPVPDYIVSTNYVGAFDPAVPRAQQWTAGWTVGVNGNDAIWRFFGGVAGTALANASVPVAAGTCPAGTTLVGPFSTVVGALGNDETRLFSGTTTTGDYDVCALPARFGDAGALTLTNDNVYVLNSTFPGTIIGNGDRARTDPAYAETASVLSIEPGTLIYGSGTSALVISRGAQINAVGRVEAPIVMTSLTQLRGRFDANPATLPNTGRGEWAGLALLGRAPDSQCQGSGTAADFQACDVLLEGNVGRYGGNLPGDSSGTLNYVIVRHAGNVISEGNELNGITAGGVGRGTRMNFIQIHRNADDGIEFFGGYVMAAHMVFTGEGDDAIDADNGFNGGIQFALVFQDNDESNRIFEQDGRFNRTPTTFPLYANVTGLAPPNRSATSRTAGDRNGILLREGLRFSFNNSIVTGDFPEGCLDVDDNGIQNATVTNTFNRVNEANGSSTTGGAHFVFRNMILDCTSVNFIENEEVAPAP